ncbi:GPI transamidase component PIG-T [Leucoagaricus sp. SymC.cos]|nr:GPI transamidase component PIG-T [Leucoagaricus sp. SymC.cos]
MKLSFSWLLLCSVFFAGGYGFVSESFSESLKLTPFADGRLSTTFSFNTILEGASPRDPRSLTFQDACGQILREYGVSELHLALNAGSWDYERWGYPEEKAVGNGAELWAWMGAEASSSVDERWKGLRNALAGLFCASLGSLDEQRTTSPTRAFFPQGVLPSWSSNVTHQLRHASMPSEHVCTENLTPFLKLLPCKSLSGISSLLNPHRVFDADWHGMGIHVLWLGEGGIEVRLTFQSVMDPLRSSRSNSRIWSLHSLFGRSIERNCPAASSSTIQVILPDEENSGLVPEPHSVSGSTTRYDVLSAEKPLNIAMQWQGIYQYHLADVYDVSLPVSVTRTLRGFTQANGILSLVLRNHKQEPQQLIYLETMPWFIQFYLHTLQARVEGRIRDDIVSDITYTMAVPHSRPTTFQAMLSLPPKSVTHLTMDVDKAFLRYTEHPPDAQRGWDLPPAVLIPLTFDSPSNDTHDSNGYRLGEPIYTSTLLVDLATPDFSMPYNVIIFTCSLVAFIFGSVFNLLTRKFVVLHLDPNQQNN